MSDIASRANATRKELKQLEEKLGADDPALQQMRAVALQWIAELQEERRQADRMPESKTA